MITQQPGTRLPKTRRAPVDVLPAMRLTERDMEVVHYVCTYRALTAPIIALRLSGEKDAPVSSRLRHRLKLLYHWRYLDRQPLSRPMGGGATFVYVPDTRGVELVAQQLGVTVDAIWQAGNQDVVAGQIEHLLEVNMIRASLEIAAPLDDITLIQWQDDLAFRRSPIQMTMLSAHGSAKAEQLVPDGFCLARSDKGAMGLALELDRGTETVRASHGANDWVSKCRKYLHWYHRGGYAEQVGVRGFRVLVVTPSNRRLANLRRAVEALGDRSMFYFALFDDARDPLRVLRDPVWRRAGPGDWLRLLD